MSKPCECPDRERIEELEREVTRLLESCAKLRKIIKDLEGD